MQDVRAALGCKQKPSIRRRLLRVRLARHFESQRRQDRKERGE
jgi:hypothetical protein